MKLKITDSVWRDFEKLIFQLLLEEYGIQENRVNHLTQSKKDGGYDGIFYVPYSSDMGISACHYARFLFEAKLRSNPHHDLPLQEFSKALIISINMNADKLIIATNLYFSAKTIEILSEYSEKTGLDIRFLTSFDINNWLSNGGEKQVMTVLESADILTLLQESCKVNLKRAQMSSIKGTKVYEHVATPPQLIGDARKKIREQVAALLKQTPGIVTIEGAAGVGKSVFTNHILADVKCDKGLNIVKINIEYYSTIRLLFVRLLEHIWHIPIPFLNSLDSGAIEEATQWLGDCAIPEEMHRIVIAVLSKSTNDYHEYADLFSYYLVEYLARVYCISQKRRAHLLFFTNINYADKDMLDFILLLFRRLDGNIRIVLELRTSLYLDDRVTESVWNEFLTRIYSLPNLKRRVHIQPWKPEEVTEFVRSRMISIPLSLDSIRNIYKRVGNNPLDLDAFLSYISLLPNIAFLPQSHIDEFILNCPIENQNSLIFRLINQLIQNTSLAADIFFVLGMLEGVAPNAFLMQLLGKDTQSALDYIATKTNILYLDEQFVHIGHSAYLYAVQKNDYLSLSHQQELSRKLLVFLDSLELDDFHCKAIKIKLLEVLKSFDMLAEEAHCLADSLFRMGHFYHSYRYYTIARSAIESMKLLHSRYALFQCMLGQIYSKFYLEDFSYVEMHQRLQDCKETLPNGDKGDKTSHYCYAKYLLAESYFYHLFGLFHKSLVTTREALSCLYRIKSNDIELLGLLWSEYAVAVKETSTLQEALQVFKKAEKVCPKSQRLHYAHVTHQAAMFASHAPNHALQCYESILRLEPFLNLPDRMHNRVNYITCEFYCGKTEDIIPQALQLFHETYTLGMSNEEGRLANLLGCLSLYTGKIHEAKKYFQYGIQIFHEKNYVAHLWPLYANLATLYFHCRDYEFSLDAIRSCLNILQTCYGHRIRKTQKINNTYEKLHVALVLLYGTLCEISISCASAEGAKDLLTQIRAMTKNSVIHSTLDSIRSREDALTAIGHSAFIVGGDIYIKA